MAHERSITKKMGHNKFGNFASVGKNKGKQLGSTYASMGAAVKAAQRRSKRFDMRKTK